MYKGKFVALSLSEQKEYIHANFIKKPGQGWFTLDGEYAGANQQDVIKALIDLEDEKINTMGDCMTGMCVTPPKLSDFVRKP